MISKLYQRITLLVLLILAPLCIYVFNTNTGMSGDIHFLDSLTHLPIAIETPEKNVQISSLGDAKTPEEELLLENLLQLDECTIVNPLSRGFIDLRGLSAGGNEGRPIGWGAKGYDSGVNFTIGICSSPMKKLHDKSEIQDGMNSSLIGAYYKDPKSGQYVSIGEFNTVPKFRGRKLTLTYDGGSFCNIRDENGDKIRKSTLITLTCDREMHSKAAVSYIGNSNDCSYMFEMRSHHVCPTAVKGNSTNAFWIFLIIIASAVIGISSGNILYKQMKKPKRINI
ncbi:Cation-independent mannose-6-phosphate receptor CI-MPR [Yamadazyma tenuis]|uniref:Mannose 6-phosphate receptor domain-containing protein n=1 Tax=Candida tenuis (strain ATCC 10573 / BCRC 21748 / CBS 615 / JCM 9827 / NBRC 10315 / NRRL Y-1498 / VKM Y-70) TaxID=590646 RepID=G3AYV7_CANTC|nr:mannose 6-phosphate receptor domain-containing protein [Yamadazyma tenuis ATCC 10573]EGV65940.1 mannose 6-phosphate receptor domain-containing protein [Yamadazyma tenuis ATCC 10573]WEJ95729.1 Cation-independent mannose-6-phosphate receptor CI-MPR [Yamadazyma tenuis]